MAAKNNNHDKTSQMLETVTAAMQEHKRPRKNPGKPRPDAVLQDGQELQKIYPRHIQEIDRLSLPGAFRYAQITGPHKPDTVQQAKRAFYEAHTGQSSVGAAVGGTLDLEIDKIDQIVSDSRQIIRSLKAAQKKQRRVSKDTLAET